MLAEAATATNNRTAVIAAIQSASQATGTNFDYLLSTAMRESGLKTDAKASTSSASGLYQFVDQTWLSMIKNHGAKYGLGSYADAITQGANGRYRVANSADRSAILSLRNDPKVASLMEGEYAQQSRAALSDELGRDVCGGELYAAHFLGNGAACRLIRMNDSNPDANAAHAFPDAAGANWNVFHHSDGSAKTVREVYDWAMKQPGGAATVSKPTTDSAVAMSGAPSATVDSAALLPSFTSWRPKHGFFGSGTQDDSASATSFLLSPGVMSVLTSLDPVAPALPTN